MITFEEIKKRANDICDAINTANFQEVYDEACNIKELSPADLMTITRLADIYCQVKANTLSREEAKKSQQEIFKEWEREIR